jgi:hypothetical protein
MSTWVRWHQGRPTINSCTPQMYEVSIFRQRTPGSPKTHVPEGGTWARSALLCQGRFPSMVITSVWPSSTLPGVKEASLRVAYPRCSYPPLATQLSGCQSWHNNILIIQQWPSSVRIAMQEARCQWLTPGISATQEAEISRKTVRSQPQASSS